MKLFRNIFLLVLFIGFVLAMTVTNTEKPVKAQGQPKMRVVDSLERGHYALIEVVCDPTHGNLIYHSGDGGLAVSHQPDICK